MNLSSSWVPPAALVLALAPAACGHAAPASSSTSTGGAGSGGAGGATTAFVPAPHPAAPIVTKGSGSVLAAPRIVVVTFAADPLAAQVEAFAAGLGKSAHWAATTAEYGVGPVTAGTPVHVAAPPAATVDDTELESWLVSQLDGTHPEWGTPDPATMYSIVYPVGTTLTQGGQSVCGSSPAYHYEVMLGSNVRVPYAAIARCDPFLGLSGIDYLTAGLSHEWVEAATDPLPASAPAYSGPSDRYNDWTLVTGGELADMCTLTSTGPYYKPADLPFTVQRSYSNAGAMAGHDPCVPAPAGPYFNAAPVLPDMLSGTVSGQAFTTEGLKIPLGKSATIEVDLFSDAETSGPWKVEASDPFGSAFMSSLSFSWDRTQGKNGDKLSLTITRKGNPPGITGVNPFVLVSTLGGEQHAWVGAVGD